MIKIKNIFIDLFLMCLFICCDEAKNQNSNIVTNTTIDTVSIIKNVKDTLPQNEIEDSEINWKYYLDKNDFEQSSSDSSLFIFVRPNYAIFVFAQEDYSEYDITGFQKKDEKWIKTIDEQIKDLNELQGNYKKKWRFEDINGDDEKDLLIKIAHDGRNNKNYICYLQDKLKQEFIKIEHFDRIDNPEYDKNKKIITSQGLYHRGSNFETYRWEGENIKFIKGIGSSADGDHEYFEKNW